MIGGIGRLLMFIAYAVIAAGLLIFIIVLVNRGVQLLAGLLGYEVGDFFAWTRKGWQRLRAGREVRRLARQYEAERKLSFAERRKAYPYRCRIVEVTSDHVWEEVVGKEGMVHLTDNGSILVLLDDGSHLWGYECKFEKVEVGGNDDERIA